MTRYDPTIPAPIFDQYARRVRCYLEGHGETTATQLAARLEIPRSSLDNPYLTIRLELDHGVRRRMRPGPRVVFRLLDEDGES